MDRVACLRSFEMGVEAVAGGQPSRGCLPNGRGDVTWGLVPVGPAPRARLVFPALGDSLGSLGRFELMSRLGAGGMGEVFRAHDRLLGREVAIKLVAADLVHSEAVRRRFVRECQLAARINHAHVLPVYDAG